MENCWVRVNVMCVKLGGGGGDNQIFLIYETQLGVKCSVGRVRYYGIDVVLKVISE